jgi:predicted nucleic acid-binding protein
VVTDSAVIDCSALVRALADKGPVASSVRSRIRDVATLTAPSLLDYDLISALLGMVRGGRITPAEMEAAIAGFHAADVHREQTFRLWERVRDLNHNLSAYDAHYVALAEALELPLITCDARIKRSGAGKCAIEVFD